ncbi:MAG: polysaccharide deacetylase family protein [Paludibacter sp.]
MKNIFSSIVLFLCLACYVTSFAQHPAHVFITAGQSNTDGRVNNKLLPDYIKAMATDTVNFTKGSYQFCKISQNSHAGTFAPYWPAGRISEGMWTYDAVTYYQIEKALQENFYVVKYAVGGTSIQYPNDTASGRYWSANPEWIKNTRSYEQKGNSLLLSFTEGIDAAIDQTLSKLANGYQIDAFLWHQGESNDMYATRYYDNLNTLISYVRTHLTEKTGKDYSKLPFVFGTIPTSNRHYRVEVEAAMNRIANEDPNAYLVDMSNGELQKDRTHFTEKSAEYLGNEMYKILEKVLDLSDTKFHIAPYKNDKACAISYTFDDGYLEHATMAAPRLEKLGFRGTFWVNGNTVNKSDSLKDRANWLQLKQMVRKGHEISNHGWAHKNMNRLTLANAQKEISMNDSAIYANTGIYPTTFCYPFNAKSDSIIELASKGRVGTRTEQFSVGGKSTSENLEQRVEGLIKNKDWGVTMTHGITNGYDHFSSSDVLWNHLQKVKQMEDKIWVGTFREVAAYVKERDAFSYEVVKTQNGFTLIPTIRLDKKLFNEKLTAVIEQPDLKKVKIKQGGKHLKTSISQKNLVFQFDPYSGPLNIQISKK